MNDTHPERPYTKPIKPFFVDGHVDIPYYLMNQPKDSRLSTLENGPFTFAKAVNAGIRLFGCAVYCEDRFNGGRSFDHFEHVLKFTLDRLDCVEIIKNNKNLKHVKKDSHQIGAILLLENADALADNLTHIEHLKQTGIHVVGLTHNGKNRLADGNAVSYPNGLTEKGKNVIRALNKNRFILDVAHLHPKCFWQLLDLYEGLIISSHTGIKQVCDIPRNIDVDQAREIFERGGVVGVTFNPEMLVEGGRSNIQDVFAHLDTLVQKLGPDMAGIGSDLCGYDPVTEGIEDITGIVDLMGIMLEHGYGKEAVSKIMGLNWLRVFENHLSA